MNKAEAMQAFWQSFGMPAYSVETVPQNAKMPYITYELATDSFDTEVLMTASIWFHSYSWEGITTAADMISEQIAKMRPPTIEIDGGRLYITKSQPFAQRLADDDDAIRRILLSINVEYMTNY